MLEHMQHGDSVQYQGELDLSIPLKGVEQRCRYSNLSSSRVASNFLIML